MTLSEHELKRYSRHILLNEIGMEGQEKLKEAKVLMIGAGGLGCPALLYLAAAGVGRIGIVDFDVVDESNLQRQILYTTEDIGKSKAVQASVRLKERNPFIHTDVFNEAISVQNALEIISHYDMVIDGTDNFSTRYLINDACVLLNKPLVYGAILKFDGQLSVFNAAKKDGTRCATYRCIFPEPPAAGTVYSCSEIGVLGVLPGIIGTMQATEAIKLITGRGDVLSDKLLLINTLQMEFTTLGYSKNTDNWNQMPANETEFRKMNYAYFCGETEKGNINEISPKELLNLMNTDQNIQIIDVRNPMEEPLLPSFATHEIPLSVIMNQEIAIDKNKKTIVFCKSGLRSAQAVKFLQNEYGCKNIYNLSGGVIAWLKHSKHI